MSTYTGRTIESLWRYVAEASGTTRFTVINRTWNFKDRKTEERSTQINATYPARAGTESAVITINLNQLVSTDSDRVVTPSVSLIHFINDEVQPTGPKEEAQLAALMLQDFLTATVDHSATEQLFNKTAQHGEQPLWIAQLQ